EAASTPSAPAQAVFDCLDAAGVEASALASVTLGTTVGTNALLERKGARVVLLTTAGFEDVTAIGRIDKEDPYDLRPPKPTPPRSPPGPTASAAASGSRPTARSSRRSRTMSWSASPRSSATGSPETTATTRSP